MPYKIQKNDEDWRNKEGDKHDIFHLALDKAFENTEKDRNDFVPTKWAKTEEGKTIPVEYKTRRNAEVSIDEAHLQNGPDCPHVGWQKEGKGKEFQSGHILLDFVPAYRDKKKT